MMLFIHYLSKVPNILLTIKFNTMVSFGLFTKAQCTPQSSCCELVVYSEHLIANLRSIRPGLSQCLKVRDVLYGTKENETFPENYSCSPNCMMSYKFPNLIDFLIYGRKIALEKDYWYCQIMPLFVSQNDHLPFLNYLKLILACCVIPNYCGVRMPQFQIQFASQGLCLNVIMWKW